MTESKTKLMQQGAALLVALGTGFAAGKAASPDVAPTEPSLAAPAPRRVDKRLDLATDADVAPGATITASGEVALGTRLVDVAGCVGRYDAVTRICVLSPGPWELHSACYERSGADATSVCEVMVRNAGSVPLKFAGYVEVAVP